MSFFEIFAGIFGPKVCRTRARVKDHVQLAAG
jgi:hypothetical protein